ncbi:MAG: hypothetical protein K1X67_18965 [Fimbriimonadaceae bacterium]|nr:hypothetical protein [Fimbriimonadaceae bacterium]
MDNPLDLVTREDFDTYRDIRVGQANGERMENPYWTAMVQCGWQAYDALKHFGLKSDFAYLSGGAPRPVWCFHRLGMSCTLLQDYRMLFIGGEHEDGYDPDFAIYNDVIVRHWDGRIRIYGYPIQDFPPTDFHSATLVGEDIYIIGARRLSEDRVYGTTPVYRLNLEDMVIQGITISGEEPGWIQDHDALYWKEEHSIVIWGGEISTGDNESHINQLMWSFSLATNTWRRIESLTLREASDRWWN